MTNGVNGLCLLRRNCVNNRFETHGACHVQDGLAPDASLPRQVSPAERQPPSFRLDIDETPAIALAVALSVTFPYRRRSGGSNFGGCGLRL
jgi:hypothetical protein